MTRDGVSSGGAEVVRVPATSSGGRTVPSLLAASGVAGA